MVDQETIDIVNGVVELIPFRNLMLFDPETIITPDGDKIYVLVRSAEDKLETYEWGRGFNFSVPVIVNRKLEIMFDFSKRAMLDRQEISVIDSDIYRLFNLPKMIKMLALACPGVTAEEAISKFANVVDNTNDRDYKVRIWDDSDLLVRPKLNILSKKYLASFGAGTNVTGTNRKFELSTATSAIRTNLWKLVTDRELIWAEWLNWESMCRPVERIMNETKRAIDDMEQDGNI